MDVSSVTLEEERSGMDELFAYFGWRCAVGLNLLSRLFVLGL